jgi:hypothetical protein
MSRENPLRGAPKIHGELLKLGFDISETSVSKHFDTRQRVAIAIVEVVFGEPREELSVGGLFHSPHDSLPDPLCLPRDGA